MNDTHTNCFHVHFKNAADPPFSRGRRTPLFTRHATCFIPTGAYVRLGEVMESGAYFGTSVSFSATALAVAKGRRGALELLSSRLPFAGWVRVKVYRGAEALLKGRKMTEWALRWLLVAPVYTVRLANHWLEGKGVGMVLMGLLCWFCVLVLCVGGVFVLCVGVVCW